MKYAAAQSVPFPLTCHVRARLKSARILTGIGFGIYLTIFNNI